MGDTENALPPSKKRAAGRELSRDNPGLDDEEDSSELEAGTFKKASDEVLASRRIVKVRRPQTTSAPSFNPFASICLVPPTVPSSTSTTVSTEATATNEVKEDAEGAKTQGNQESVKGEAENSKQSESKIDEPAAEAATSNEAEADKGENVENKANEAVTGAAADKESVEGLEISSVATEALEGEVDNEKAAEVEKNENEENKESKEEKEGGDKKENSIANADTGGDGASLNSFQQLSSTQNAFTGLAGTGFSTSTFSFGVPKDGSALSSGSGSIFGQKSDQTSFSFGLPNNGNSSLFNAAGTSIVSKTEGTKFPPKQEVVVETGEENEKVVFSADSVLFEFADGSWKERGKGEIKVNISTAGTKRARLLMRTRGNYRLILNASLFADMKLTNMDKKGITFACINSAGEGKDGLCTFALKFKDGSMVDEFRAAVLAHKDTPTAPVLKTPENSPKASNE